MALSIETSSVNLSQPVPEVGALNTSVVNKEPLEKDWVVPASSKTKTHDPLRRFAPGADSIIEHLHMNDAEIDAAVGAILRGKWR